MKITLFLFAILFLQLVLPSSVLAAGKSQPPPCNEPLRPQAIQSIWTESSPNTGEVTIHWGSVGTDADKYAIVYGTESNKYKWGSQNIGSTTSQVYTVKFLDPNKTYYFRMYAIKACSKGISDPSPEVSSTTVLGKDNEEPALGGKLTVATGPEKGQVTLSWAKVDGANNYHVMYGKKVSKYEYGALNIGDVNAITIKELTPGQAYYFTIVPVDNKYRYNIVKMAAME